MEDKNHRVWAYTDSNLQHLQNIISIFNYESKNTLWPNQKQKKKELVLPKISTFLLLTPSLTITQTLIFTLKKVTKKCGDEYSSFALYFLYLKIFAKLVTPPKNTILCPNYIWRQTYHLRVLSARFISQTS